MRVGPEGAGDDKTARFVGVFLTRRREVELSDEIQAHLDLLTAEHLRRGPSLDEARAAARRDFGSVEQIKESYRDERGWRLVGAPPGSHELPSMTG